MPATGLSIIIQAGGESRRMGRDKGLAPFLGRTLIERVIERLQPLGAPFLVTTNRPQEYAFLGLPLLPDLRPGQGALSGLYTALSGAPTALAAVVACDMPFASPEIFALQAERLAQGDWAAIIPRSAEGFEPFHASYRGAACLPLIEAALDAGQRRVNAWFEQARIGWMEDYAGLDPGGRAFWNANTPEELAEAEEKCRVE